MYWLLCGFLLACTSTGLAVRGIRKRDRIITALRYANEEVQDELDRTSAALTATWRGQARDQRTGRFGSK